LTVDALLYSVHVSCTFHALYWKWSPKVEGDQYIAGPPNQNVGGDLSPPVPMVVAPMQRR